MEESVKVFVRVRPLKSGEVNSITIKGNQIQAQDKVFTYDQVFNPQSNQQQIFEEIKPIVDSVIAGYNGTIFAYGQTSSGKTHTMTGSFETPKLSKSENTKDQFGVVQRCFDYIFNTIQKKNERKFIIYVTYLEIYNEEIIDLLVQQNQKLELKETKSGFHVKGVSKHTVKSIDEMQKLLYVGQQNRSVGSTLMNEKSSRSHSVFTICVESCDNGSNQVTQGKLNILDLAGSERQSKSGSTGERLKEATKINLSLSALGNVISALSESKPHIPYRDSKLTKLLMDSLGGTSKTAMIATVSPASYNLDETVNTLKYAQRAKRIKNKPVVNIAEDSLLLDYQNQIQKLKTDLQRQNKSQKLQDIETQQRLIDQERIVLERSKDIITEEKQKLLNQIAQKQKDLDMIKTEKNEILKTLKHFQDQIFNYGDDVQGFVQKQNHEVRQQKQMLDSFTQQTEELHLKLKSIDDNQGKVNSQTYSLAREVSDLDTQIQSLVTKITEIRSKKSSIDVKSKQSIEELIDGLNDVQKQIKLYDLLIDEYIPQNFAKDLKSRAFYNEKDEEWEFKGLKDKDYLDTLLKQKLTFIGPETVFNYPASLFERRSLLSQNKDNLNANCDEIKISIDEILDFIPSDQTKNELKPKINQHSTTLDQAIPLFKKKQSQNKY